MTDQDIRLSFEFFPPKTDQGREKLKTVRSTLSSLKPEFFSCTYGAGGSTRDNTRAVVEEIAGEGLNVAPHLSFGGDNEETLLQLINDYKEMGIKRIVALRGDRPSGLGGSGQMVYANELVAHIRENFGDSFHIEVAAYPEIHPEATSYVDDVKYLKGKFDAGANSAITQYFFNLDAYFYFIDECQKQGITQAIYPGIMPIINFQNLVRFSNNCGAEIPRWLCKRMEAFKDDQDSIKKLGVEIVSELGESLLENGAPGIHFYTMNQAEPCLAIAQNLELTPVD